MANMQIKGIDENFYSKIKEMAIAENRSISQQVLYIIKLYLSKEKQLKNTKTSAQVLLELSGSWIDKRNAEEIIHDIRKSRKNSKKLAKGF